MHDSALAPSRRRAHTAPAALALAALALAALARVGPARATAPSTPAQRAQGAALFARNCARCHGAGARGVRAHEDGRIHNALVGRALGEAAVRAKVRAANSYAMPSFDPARLPEPALDAVVAYLRAVGAVSPDAPPPPPRGDAR